MTVGRVSFSGLCFSLLIAGCSASDSSVLDLHGGDRSDSQSNTIEFHAQGESRDVRYPEAPAGHIAVRTIIEMSGPEGAIIEDERGQLYYPTGVADEGFDYVCGTSIGDRSFSLRQVGAAGEVVTLSLKVEWESCPTADAPISGELSQLQKTLCAAIVDKGADVRIEEGCELPDPDALGTSPAPLVGDPVAGEQFASRCRACHNLEKGKGPKVGPNLYGVVGRVAGTDSAFASRFSRGLAGSEIVWTPETLDAYISAPKTLVPGTKMPRQRYREDARRDLIAYLQTLHD